MKKRNAIVLGSSTAQRDRSAQRQKPGISPGLCRLLFGSACLFAFIGAMGLWVCRDPGLKEALGFVCWPALPGSCALLAGALVFWGIYLTQSITLVVVKRENGTEKRILRWRSL